MVGLSSMTGFGRADGEWGDLSWSWELRSVNGRGLDFRFRLPSGCESLSATLRARAQNKLTRGHVHIALQLTQHSNASAIRVNARAIDKLLPVVRELERQGLQKARADGLLALRGVIEIDEPRLADDALQARDNALLESFIQALDMLVASRKGEGRDLAAIIETQLTEVARLTQEAAQTARCQPDAIHEKLRHQLSQLLEVDTRFSVERLHVEAALLASKADIREELDRLKTHTDSARQLVGTGGVIGRQFDFLVQEMNREANTLCAKASDVTLSQTGIALKVVLDQIREQVQNIE